MSWRKKGTAISLVSLNNPQLQSADGTDSSCRISNFGKGKIWIVEQFDHPLFACSSAVMEIDEGFNRPQDLRLVHLSLYPSADFRSRTSLTAGKDIVTIATRHDADIAGSGP